MGSDGDVGVLSGDASGRVDTMKPEDIKAIGKQLGYELNDEDCQEIIDTSYEGELVSEAVDDFLNAYER